jgi:hypothetical protein
MKKKPDAGAESAAIMCWFSSLKKGQKISSDQHAKERKRGGVWDVDVAR